jgi:hypothetical protein
VISEEDHSMSQTCGCHHGGPSVTDHRAGGTDPVSLITPEETVDAIGRRAPHALATLRGFGIDTCCGGGLTLAQAAASAGVPMATVVRALGGDGSPA